MPVDRSASRYGVRMPCEGGRERGRRRPTRSQCERDREPRQVTLLAVALARGVALRERQRSWTPTPIVDRRTHRSRDEDERVQTSR